MKLQRRVEFELRHRENFWGTPGAGTVSWRYRAQGIVLERGEDGTPPGKLPLRCQTCGTSFDLQVYSLKAANRRKLLMWLLALVGLAIAVASVFWLISAIAAADAAEGDGGGGIVLLALLCVIVGLVVLILGATAASNYLGISGKGVTSTTVGKHVLGPITPPPTAAQQPGAGARQHG